MIFAPKKPITILLLLVIAVIFLSILLPKRFENDRLYEKVIGAIDSLNIGSIAGFYELGEDNKEADGQYVWIEEFYNSLDGLHEAQLNHTIASRTIMVKLDIETIKMSIKIVKLEDDNNKLAYLAVRLVENGKESIPVFLSSQSVIDWVDKYYGF